jgi:hypothetical protein
MQVIHIKNRNLNLKLIFLKWVYFHLINTLNIILFNMDV